MARFARTHASWTDPDISMNDLLVSLADKVWKGARVTDLEQRVLERLPGEAWDTFLRLDNILAPIAGEADRLLAFQFRHPVRIV